MSRQCFLLFINEIDDRETIDQTESYFLRTGQVQPSPSSSCLRTPKKTNTRVVNFRQLGKSVFINLKAFPNYLN